jgi:hypothetical protein
MAGRLRVVKMSEGRIPKCSRAAAERWAEEHDRSVNLGAGGTQKAFDDIARQYLIDHPGRISRPIRHARTWKPPSSPGARGKRPIALRASPRRPTMQPAASSPDVVAKVLRGGLALSLVIASASGARAQEGTPTDPAVVGPGEKAVLTLGAAAATKFLLGLCRFGQLRPDGTQTPGYFALLRTRAPASGAIPLGYAIIQHSGKTWALRVKEAGPWLDGVSREQR